MLDKYYHVVLYNLQKFTVPFFVKTQLENVYNPHYSRLERTQEAKSELLKEKKRSITKINYLEDKINKKNLLQARDSNDDFADIATRASIYFQQGYEMFKTSLTMNENSSPLVEYYALLQCVKGALMLHYNVKNEVFFFTHHGLNIEKKYQNKPPYISAEVSNRGVFYGLIVIFCNIELKGYPRIDDYLPGKYKPVLSEVIEGFRYLETFTGSWMLSNLVRYKPDLWQKIIVGKEDDIINEIREFRGNHIPQLVHELLKKFGYKNTLPYKWGSDI
ncbi:MAG: hypothetical protein KAU62_17375 [Candidatus Heimdallarchaeota archaeon]|nr:hypothetical protein [Candidatus Heimdallarchaeota archaeon]MCG3257880.1 hypothetical protein [Candidatus Heimdallarchaeota archaeon]MCK4612931.1 hypothetical protein [Candidatus Heimdallarchaeota archaeon]